MDGWIARKKISIYMVLFCWGIAVAEMEPGFHTIVGGTVLLAALTIMRLVAHTEGQYMLKQALASGHGPTTAHAVVYRRLITEMLVGAAFFAPIGFAVVWAMDHWIYVPMAAH